MRQLALAVVAAAWLLGQTFPATDQLLVIPQEDRLRSRMSPATASVSADGRYIALTSRARFATADLDDLPDIYLLDRTTNGITLESTGDDGTASYSHPRLSSNARYLTFDETLRDREGRTTVRLVVRDRVADLLTRLKPDVADRWTGSASLSADGRVVAFASNITNLTSDRDENGGVRDVFFMDTQTGRVARANIDGDGRQPTGDSSAPAVSGDGRYVVFTSIGEHGPEGTKFAGVYVRDIQQNSTRCISGRTDSNTRRGSSYDGVISRDGRYIAFASEDAELARDDRNRTSDVFLHDTVLGSTVLVSRSAAGGSGNGTSRNPAVSSDGRFVVFQSEASDLVCAARCPPADEDINLLPDIFLFDRSTGRIVRLSQDASRGWSEESIAPAMNDDGTVIVFSSRHPIDADDVDHDLDLFIRVAGRVATTSPARR